MALINARISSRDEEHSSNLGNGLFLSLVLSPRNLATKVSSLTHRQSDDGVAMQGLYLSFTYSPPPHSFPLSRTPLPFFSPFHWLDVRAMSGRTHQIKFLKNFSPFFQLSRALSLPYSFLSLPLSPLQFPIFLFPLSLSLASSLPLSSLAFI